MVGHLRVWNPHPTTTTPCSRDTPESLTKTGLVPSASIRHGPLCNFVSRLSIQKPIAMSTQKTLFGFLGGIALGATLGLLFAPASGKDTRKKLRRRGERAKDDLSDLIDQGRAEWSKARNKAADAATMTKEEVQDFVRFMMSEGRDLKDRIKDDVRSTASEVAANGRRAAEDVRRTN